MDPVCQNEVRPTFKLLSPGTPTSSSGPVPVSVDKSLPTPDTSVCYNKSLVEKATFFQS